MPQEVRLPPCIRHITTHQPDGKSVFANARAPQYFHVPKLGHMARSYAVEGFPVKVEEDVDLLKFESGKGRTGYHRQNIVVPNGSNFVVLDFEPGGETVLHQTVSVDLAVCTNGTLQHKLDSGQVVTLKPGVGRPTYPSVWTIY